MDSDAPAAAAAAAPRLSSRLAQKRQREQEEEELLAKAHAEEQGKKQGAPSAKAKAGDNGGGGKRPAKKGKAGPTTAPLKGLASLPQSYWLLFKSEVLSPPQAQGHRARLRGLPALPPHLLRVSKELKRGEKGGMDVAGAACWGTHSPPTLKKNSDEVWEPLLAKFDNGTLLKELEGGECLSNPYNQARLCHSPCHSHTTQHNTTHLFTHTPHRRSAGPQGVQGGLHGRHHRQVQEVRRLVPPLQQAHAAARVLALLRHLAQVRPAHGEDQGD